MLDTGIPLNIIPLVHECFMTLSGLFYNPGSKFPAYCHNSRANVTLSGITYSIVSTQLLSLTMIS